jgi:D-threo-aldose 1-dehydrogenase
VSIFAPPRCNSQGRPDVAAALVVGCKNEQQILAHYSSMQIKIPAEFWADLKAQNLIEQNPPIPA